MTEQLSATPEIPDKEPTMDFACQRCMRTFHSSKTFPDCPFCPELPLAQRHRASGARVEKLSLEIIGTEYEHIEKINEMIDRINQLNGWRTSERVPREELLK